MKTKILLSTLFASFLLVTNLRGQQPTFEWVKQMGGSAWDETSSITTDVNGNIYSTGLFSNTVDFDPGPGIVNLTAVGGYDIFIQKLDANGNFVWAKQMGGGAADIGNSVTTDSYGNVYTTGYFSWTVDFDPGPGTTNLTSAGWNDFFLQKLDANGNFLWVKQMGGIYDDHGFSIAIDADGNVYTTGFFLATVYFGPGPASTSLTTAGINDIFIQKLDTNGNLLWVKQMGGTWTDWGISITTDNNGNVYTTGLFGEIADFDPNSGVTNLTSAGKADIFIQKLDSIGNLLWVRQMGGTWMDRGNSISTDPSGNVYTTGIFSLTCDFDPGGGISNLTAVDSFDIFIQKLDSNGNFLWVKQMGGVHDDIGISIATDAIGNVYTTGYFGGSADFDPGAGTTNLTSAGKSDIFVQKLDSNGNFLWVKQLGSNDNDRGNSVITDANGSIYASGCFQNTVDFDPGAATTNLISSGLEDIFILKLSQTGTVGISENTFTENIQVYPNPTTGNFAIKFETVQKELSVRIISITGQIIESRTFQDTDFVQMNLDRPKGIYLVDVLNEQGNKTVFQMIKN